MIVIIRKEWSTKPEIFSFSKEELESRLNDPKWYKNLKVISSKENVESIRMISSNLDWFPENSILIIDGKIITPTEKITITKTLL